MAAEEEVAAEQPPAEAERPQDPEATGSAAQAESAPPEPASKKITKEILSTCLTRGLAALCAEKPAEPVRWLAEWLLEHNPNTPVTTIPATSKPISAGTSAISSAEMSAISASRSGQVLGATKTLVELDMARGGDSSNSVNGVMGGATFFHQVAAYRVGSVGPCTSQGVAAVIGDMLQLSKGNPKCVHWMSVRNDATIYLGGAPYAVRGAEAGDESLLKADCEAEIGARGGRIAVTDAKGKGKWLHVATGDALTPANVVSGVSAPGGIPVRYHSFPCPANAILSNESIDETLAILTALDPQDPIIISTDLGDGAPSTMFGVIACMAVRVRAAGGKLPQDVLPKEPLPIVAKFAPARELLEDVREVESIITSLGEELGAQAKLLLDETMDTVARNRFRNLRTAYLQEVKAGQDQAARTTLVQYLRLLTVAAILISPEETKDVPHQAFADLMRGGV